MRKCRKHTGGYSINTVLIPKDRKKPKPHK